MYTIVLDEMGHDGPYHPVHHPDSSHPLFGYGGLAIPYESIHDFSRSFLASKVRYSKPRPAQDSIFYELKGSRIFRPRLFTATGPNADSYRAKAITAGDDLLRNIAQARGMVVCWQKLKEHRLKPSHNPRHLHKAATRHIIRAAELYFRTQGHKYVVVFDEHSQHLHRRSMVVQIMLHKYAARSLSDPPWWTSSDYSMLVQAADWIAALVGRLSLFKLDPVTYAHMKGYEDHFGPRIAKLLMAGSKL